MKRRHFSKIFLVLSVLTLTIALYGCTGGKEGEGNENPTSADNSSSGEPTYGGSVVVGIQQDLDSLDPHLAVAAGTREVLFNIFEGLVKPDEDGNLVPAVASDYSVSDDGKIYTFKLREGVKFHNGATVTAEDVKYSIDRCAGKLGGEALVSALSVIDSVNIVDQSTIQIVLSEPDTELIGYLTVAIIPKDYDNQAQAPVGTGPFQFVSYTPQQNLIVKKFDDYWQDGVPYLDQVEFKIVSNTDSVLLDLKGGSIDIYAYLTADQANELKSSFQILEGNMNLVQALFLNNKSDLFDDVKVRQAIAYAVNRQEILDMVAGGKGTIIGSNMFHGFSKYYDAELADVYAQDIKKAKQLLKEAGYPDGFEMTIKVPSNYQFHVDTAQVIVEQLKQVGITAKIELVEWTTWLSDVYKARDYEATVIGLDAQLAPKDLMDRYASDASNNFVNFSNTQYDDILKKAIATTNDDEKVKYYKQLQKILTDNAASVYIQDPALTVAMNKKLAGYKFYPVYVQDMSSVYFKK